MFPISPLRYPGGKARLAPTIAAIMKSAGFGDDVVFVEPFAGGAGAGLTLLFTATARLRDRAAARTRFRRSRWSLTSLLNTG
ncbi:MAG: DNA adenine methylase [Thermoguttaceae bacterium]|nr:DNA adenine methylase [Thermoguttaceae bacterium]